MRHVYEATLSAMQSTCTYIEVLPLESFLLTFADLDIFSLCSCACLVRQCVIEL